MKLKRYRICPEAGKFKVQLKGRFWGWNDIGSFVGGHVLHEQWETTLYDTVEDAKAYIDEKLASQKAQLKREIEEKKQALSHQLHALDNPPRVYP